MATVTSDDVATSLGRPLNEVEAGQVTLWGDDAEMLIVSEMGPLVGLDFRLVGYVIRESIVARIRKGPGQGLESLTVAVDDGNVTRRFASPVEREDWLLPGWQDLLRRRVESSAFSTRPGFVPDRAAGRGMW